MKEIFHRVSVRKFEETKVEKEKLEKLLRAAMQSPSAMNQQPWEFYVIEDKDILLKLSKATPYSMCVKNAPMAIVICYQKETPANEYKEIDCAIATENILLEADGLGLGGVMIGVAPVEERMQKVEEILSLPTNLRAFTIIPIGYPLKQKTQEDRYNPSKVHYI